jgi:hypothetical protein
MNEAGIRRLERHRADRQEVTIRPWPASHAPRRTSSGPASASRAQRSPGPASAAHAPAEIGLQRLASVITAGIILFAELRRLFIACTRIGWFGVCTVCRLSASSREAIKA